MRAAALLFVAVIGMSCAGDIGGATAPTTPAQAKETILSARLVDVRGGEAFTLRDFSGKVVLVVGMAVW